MSAILKHIKGDKAIWLVIFFLSIASILLVYSSIVTLAYKHHAGNTGYYLIRHGLFVVLGVGIIYAIHKIRYNYFSRIAQVALYVAIPLLLLTLLIGANINDASRWLKIPVVGVTFQTSDFAKLALIMYVARMLSIKQGMMKDFKKGFLPIIIPVFVVCALILPANFSTAAVLFTSCIVLMFIGRVNMKYIFAMIGIGVVGLGLVFLIAKASPELFPRFDTWMNRIENFQNPDTKASYQVEQSKIAIATGGIQGKGPGNSTQRNFLPHPYSDFIYAIVLEEYGLLGGLFVLLLYLILLYRAVRIVMKSPKAFGALLAIGITFGLVFQAMINMAVAVNLLPVTGQPLPLMSMGGTSIWFTCIAIGIILSVSRGVEESNPKLSNVTA